MGARGGWKTTADAEERHRRSVYVFVKRNTRYPMFEAFDMPDTHESCSRRNVTTTPLQALHMLNSELTLDWASHFAARVWEMSGPDASRRVETAFRLAYGRQPDAAEAMLARDFLSRQREVIRERAEKGEALAAPPRLPAEADKVEGAALVDFCHMLLNANEFVYSN